MPPPTIPPITGARIPELHLTDHRGTHRSVRATARDAFVLLRLPEWDGAWLETVVALGSAADDIEQWSAHIVVIISGAVSDAAELRARTGGRLDVRADFGSDATRALGIDARHAGLVIADRFRQVYTGAQARHPSELPGLADMEEWARYLATQCPECGVIDEPGHGEWASD